MDVMTLARKYESHLVHLTRTTVTSVSQWSLHAQWHPSRKQSPRTAIDVIICV